MDLGAQYMTVTEEHQQEGGHRELYGELLGKGLLKPMVRDLSGTSTGSNRLELGEEKE